MHDNDIPSLLSDVPAQATLVSREDREREAWLPAVQGSFAPVVPAPAAVRALLAVAQPVVVPRGVQFLSRQNTAEHHWLLVTGLVAMGLAEGGRIRQQTREVNAGHWIDNASALVGDAAHYMEDGVAERDSLVLSFPHREVVRCGLRHPQLLLGLASSMVSRVQAMLAAELSLMRQSTESRLAAWLLQNAEEAPAESGCDRRVVMRQRKRAIASQLGATPETLSRVLKQLCLRGAVRVQGYVIDLTDLSALRQLAEQGR
jgi:CRP-like cAMP-binding protein